MQLQSRDQTQAIKPVIGQFGHVTASASCKQPEKHGTFCSSLPSCKQPEKHGIGAWSLELGNGKVKGQYLQGAGLN